MSPLESELLVMVSAVFGSGVLSTIIIARSNKRKMAAEVTSIQTSTVATLEPIMASWLDRLQSRIEALEKEVEQLTKLLRLETKRSRAYETALLENEIQVPPISP